MPTFGVVSVHPNATALLVQSTAFRTGHPSANSAQVPLLFSTNSPVAKVNRRLLSTKIIVVLNILSLRRCRVDVFRLQRPLPPRIPCLFLPLPFVLFLFSQLRVNENSRHIFDHDKISHTKMLIFFKIITKKSSTKNSNKSYFVRAQVDATANAAWCLRSCNIKSYSEGPLP